MRYALVVEYDGSGFHGWQRQENALGVQQCLESALSEIANHPVKVICAGRTDAGVHATAQMVHFDSTAGRALHEWRLGANAGLPDTVSVGWAGRVPEHFHARFSALERTYRYVIVNRESRAALGHRRAWCVYQRLSIAAMREAACHLIGEHDFSAFRAAGCQAKSPRRLVSRVEVSGYGDRIEIEISANAFLQNMVRIVAGVLVSVGRGDRPPEWVAELLHEKDRTRSGQTAPAAGLYLTGVRYPAEFGIPAAIASP